MFVRRPADESNAEALSAEGLATGLVAAGDFLRGFRKRLRAGRLARAPLRLLRLQVVEDTAECDWLARPADHWDAIVPPHVGQRNAVRQAIEDAIAVRSLLFAMLPGVRSAQLRIFRDRTNGRELIAVGRVERSDRVSLRVQSLVMRAKLLGFEFLGDQDRLVRIASDASSPSDEWLSTF